MLIRNYVIKRHFPYFGNYKRSFRQYYKCTVLVQTFRHDSERKKKNRSSSNKHCFNLKANLFIKKMDNFSSVLNLSNSQPHQFYAFIFSESFEAVEQEI